MTGRVLLFVAMTLALPVPALSQAWEDVTGFLGRVYRIDATGVARDPDGIVTFRYLVRCRGDNPYLCDPASVEDESFDVSAHCENASLFAAAGNPRGGRRGAPSYTIAQRATGATDWEDLVIGDRSDPVFLLVNRACALTEG